MNKLQKLQKEYLTCKAENDRVQNLSEKVKAKVLQDNNFFTEDTHKRILEPLWDFRMSETDFKIYCESCYREYLKIGLDVPNSNTTPDSKSRKNLQEAENKLLKFGIDLIVKRGDGKRKDLEEIASHWKYREEMLDLTSRLEL